MLFWVISSMSWFAPTLSAEQELVLQKINPQKTRLGVFNSYQNQLLLVAFVQATPEDFDCSPNQYVLYDYGAEDLIQIRAGNIKISSDYRHIFRTRIHALGGVTEKNRETWTQRVEALLKAMNVSPQTLEKSKMKGISNHQVCWQQPELLDIKGHRLRTYPLLAANLCRKRWCSELYWTSSNQIQFWIHQIPDEYQLIRLHIQTGEIQYQKTSPVFIRPELAQLNAPRENLVTEENIEGHAVVLSTHQKKQIKLVWRKQADGKTIISLNRDSINEQAAQRHLSKISAMIEQRRIPEALTAIRFALWLEPDNLDLRIERLKAFTLLLALDQFYDALKNDFTPTERFNACQRLHLDPFFKSLWKRPDFVTQFKEICFLN